MPHAHIIGSGPNGLAAAITMAQSGMPVTVYERNAQIGGACTTGERTLPGFRHDLGSSVYPMGVASPFFRSLPLAGHGFEWIHPSAPLAHPLDDGTAVMLEYSLDDTADNLNAVDGRAWRHVMTPLINRWFELLDDVLAPPVHWPKHPFLMARFGFAAALPAAYFARQVFQGTRAQALFAGCAAHSVMPLNGVFSSAIGLILSAAAQTTGWPMAAGGSQSLTDALVAHLRSLGGEIVVNHEITDLKSMLGDGPVLADVTPRQVVQLAGDALSSRWQSRLGNFEYGPGSFKIDYALSEPIPWTAKDCSRAGTVHLGGTLDQVVESEDAVFGGDVHDAQFVLVVQPSLFDPSRAPAGTNGQPQHTAWAYCHVPNGYTGDATAAIEGQMERFAPGFREIVLARAITSPSQLEEWNPNLVGGDLSGGAMTPMQIAFRPTTSLYRAGHRNLYLCSSSTPPGGGVHGMCGHLAALEALKHL
jgi:phytoene dehydrogenase-like protein